jgi:hypothetical protein
MRYEEARSVPSSRSRHFGSCCARGRWVDRDQQSAGDGLEQSLTSTTADPEIGLAKPQSGYGKYAHEVYPPVGGRIRLSSHLARNASRHREIGDLCE